MDRSSADSPAGGLKPLGHGPADLAEFGDQGLFHTSQVRSKDGSWKIRPLQEVGHGIQHDAS